MVKARYRARGVGLAILALVLLLTALPACAGAHAQIVSTSPTRDATVETMPKSVEFTFNEAVEANFGAIRVYGPGGTRADRGEPMLSDGDRTVTVSVDGSADGTYTTTYRVVSADSHPVSGGFVFHVGESSANGAGSVAELISDAEAGAATTTANTIATFLGFAALAIVFGGLVFLKFMFLPAVSRVGEGAESTIAAFRRRCDPLIGAAVVVGLIASICELVLQGAIASGQDFLSSLKSETIGAVLETRSGMWMAVRVLVWLAIAVVWFAAARRPRTHSATAVLLVLTAVAAQMPALVGHAGATGPRILMPIADFIHVAAASVWVGGLAMAVVALPAATAQLPARRRTGLMVDVFARFSPLALGAVALIVVTGAAQSVSHLTEFSELFSTAFGRAIAVKSALLLVLVGLGAYNRQIVLPALRRLNTNDDSPGAVGTRFKRVLTTEVAISAVVLAVAAMLVGYSPASTASGPFSETTAIGPAELQVTVDPARVGTNEFHVYLIDPNTGAAFTSTKEFTVSAALEDPPVGPIVLNARKAGPGHYVVTSANFAVSGDWRINLVARTSEFDQYERTIEVPIR